MLCLATAVAVPRGLPIIGKPHSSFDSIGLSSLNFIDLGAVPSQRCRPVRAIGFQIIGPLDQWTLDMVSKAERSRRCRPACLSGSGLPYSVAQRRAFVLSGLFRPLGWCRTAIVAQLQAADPYYHNTSSFLILGIFKTPHINSTRATRQSSTEVECHPTGRGLGGAHRHGRPSVTIEGLQISNHASCKWL
jgi:hypothetical protein